MHMKNTLIFGAFLAVMAFIGTFAGSAITVAATGESPIEIVMRWREEDAAQESTPVDVASNDNPDVMQPEPENSVQGTEPQRGGDQVNDNLQENKDIFLGSTKVDFELHPVMSGLGNNYLFDITVGHTEKKVIESVSSDELTEFMNSIDFSGTNGNAVLMFEDGTGITIMQDSKIYYADYGYVDVSDGEFTMTDRLGALWNDTGDGWYYKTVDEMRNIDAGEKEIEPVKPSNDPETSPSNTPAADVPKPSAESGQSSSQQKSSGGGNGSASAIKPVDPQKPASGGGQSSSQSNPSGAAGNSGSSSKPVDTSNPSNDGSSSSAYAGKSSTDGNSTTNEITGSLDRTAYWVDDGKSYHFSSGCRSLAKSKNIVPERME